MLMLRRTLNARIGQTGLAADYIVKLWVAAGAGAAAAWAVKFAIPALHPTLAAMFVLGSYGLVFFSATFALHIPEASTMLRRFRWN
jgi:putative peptidoglycan lipid II flippase